MKVDDCYQLGYVIKPHGLKGELMIYLDVDFPEDYENLESLMLLQKHQLIPFFVEHISLQPGSKAIVKLDEISTRESAEALMATEIYLPLSTLPDLDDDQFYFHEVVGYQMMQGGNLVGTITAVIDSGPQLLFEVAVDDFEILVPIVDEIIIEVDNDAKQVEVLLPDGLIDIYRNLDLGVNPDPE
jgi:16S rRNA processing protein RimM